MNSTPRPTFWAIVVTLTVCALARSMRDSEAEESKVPQEDAARQRPAEASPSATRQIIDASDYPDLHAAVAALPASGGLLWIPPGEYEIDQPLWIITDNTRIQGAGAATRVINRNEQQQHAIVLEHKDRPREPLARLSHVELVDLRVSGNPKSGDGVFVEGVKELSIRGVTVDHHGEHGIRLLDVFEGPRVLGSSVHDNGFDGLYTLASSDLVVSANQFARNRDAINAQRTKTLCLNGNNISHHRRHGIHLDSATAAAISGNVIASSGAAAVLIEKNFRGGSLTGNVFRENAAGVHVRGAAGAVVTGNSFVGAHAPGIKGVDCKNMVVVANALGDSVTGVDLGASLGSITAQNAQ